MVVMSAEWCKMIEEDVKEIKISLSELKDEIARVRSQQGELIKYVVVGLLAIVATVVGLKFALPA